MKKLLLTCVLQLFVYNYGGGTDSYIYDYRPNPPQPNGYYYSAPYYTVQPRQSFWSPSQRYGQQVWQPYTIQHTWNWGSYGQDTGSHR